MSSTANMMRRRPSVFAGAFGSALTAVGLWNYISSSRPWPSGVRTIATSTRTSSSPTTRGRPTSLGYRLALQLQTKFDKERGSSLEVVDNNADVLHPLDRQAESPWCGTTMVAASAPGTEPQAVLDILGHIFFENLLTRAVVTTDWRYYA